MSRALGGEAKMHKKCARGRGGNKQKSTKMSQELGAPKMDKKVKKIGTRG